MLSKQALNLASFGALGLVGGVTVIYAALVWLSLPTGIAPAAGAVGGFDSITGTVLRVAALVPASIFVGAHLVFARHLAGGAKSLNQ